MLRRNSQHKAVRVKKDVVQGRIADPVLDQCKIKFVILQHAVQLVRGISDDLEVHTVIHADIGSQSLHDHVAFCGVSNTYGKRSDLFFFVLQITFQKILESHHPADIFYDDLSFFGES